MIVLSNVWLVMFTQLRPMAVNWATRSGEIMELDAADEMVAEWSERLRSTGRVS
jgi:hypothetical protein